MILINPCKGYFKSKSLLQVLIFSFFFLGIVNSFPSPKKSKKISSSVQQNDVAPKKKPAVNAATQKILAQAKSVEKPKGYANVLKKAKEYDKNPQIPNENNPVVGTSGYTDDEKKMWKHEMFVVIDDAFTKQQREDVESAIYTLKEAMKCFDFKITKEALPNIVDHVHIKPEDASLGKPCTSYIGREGGKQIIVVGEVCDNFYGVTMHEVMHALGFFHEHVRKDRDKYVEVDWSELTDPGWAMLYQIQNYQKAIKEYDFGSIMHYPFTDAMQPIVDVPRGVIVGQRSHLSLGDLKRLKKAYPCK